MKFTKEVVLDQPIEKVRVIVSDPAHIHQWQPDLVSITQHGDTPGEPGSTATLAYDHRGRKVRLEETVLAATDDERTSRYVTKGIRHTIKNRFIAVDDEHTRLVCENTIELTGLLKLGRKPLEKSLREQAERNVDNFKAFIDAC